MSMLRQWRPRPRSDRAAVQAYVVCELQDKHNVLWAFIKAHLKVCFSVWLRRVAFHFISELLREAFHSPLDSSTGRSR